MKKKAWVRPKLTVLVRGKPAEGVLTGCKYAPWGPGPGYYVNGCEVKKMLDPYSSYCAWCNSMYGS